MNVGCDLDTRQCRQFLERETEIVVDFAEDPHVPGTRRVLGHVADVQNGEPIREVLAGGQTGGVVARRNDVVAIAFEEAHGAILTQRLRLRQLLRRRNSSPGPADRPPDTWPAPTSRSRDLRRFHPQFLYYILYFSTTIKT